MVTAALGAISTLGGLAATGYGYYMAGKEGKRQQSLIDEQQRRLDDYYNRNYYGDYFASTEAQNAMRRVRESLQRKNEVDRGRAIVSGSTDEAQLANSANNLSIVADTASNLAEQATNIKRDADKTYLNGSNNVSQQNARLSQNRMEGYQQLAANGANVMKSGLLGMANSLEGTYDAPVQYDAAKGATSAPMATTKASAGTPLPSQISDPTKGSNAVVGGDGVVSAQDARRQRGYA